MAELPRTQDLPRTENGLDPARVEEAFAEFGERVRELESVSAELRSELRALRSERAAPPLDEDWPVEPYYGPPADWVAAIPPPLVRSFAPPRLALEALFLVAVAVLGGLADLRAIWIVCVMAFAWALVAASEWLAAQKRARWQLDDLRFRPTEAPAPAASDTTGPWDMPVVEATVIEVADGSDARTVIAALPPVPVEPEDDAPAPSAPPRRRGFLRRRASPDAAPEAGTEPPPLPPV